MRELSHRAKPLIVGPHEFQHVCDIQPTRSADGSITALMPQDRYKDAATVPLHRYGGGPFCKFQIPNFLRISGVYVLSIGDRPEYVGECDNLASRFNAGYGNISPRNCFKKGQQTNCRVNNLIYLTIAGGNSVSLWFLPTPEYKAVELALRLAHRLGWNLI